MRSLIDADSAQLSVRRQCELLGLSRSTLYYEALAETETNLCLMRLIDEQYMATPFYGSRRMAVWLTHEGHAVNRKRVQRLMQLMDLEAIDPKPRLSLTNKGMPVITQHTIRQQPDPRSFDRLRENLLKRLEVLHGLENRRFRIRTIQNVVIPIPGRCSLRPSHGLKLGNQTSFCQ